MFWKVFRKEDYNWRMDIRKVIAHETSHFYKLSLIERKLIESSFFHSLANSFLQIFINAFIFKMTAKMQAVASFNLGIFIFIAFAFFLNGLLLRRINIITLYRLGALLKGVAGIIVIFLAPREYVHLIIAGGLYGMGTGFYWSNRNFLTLKLTQPKTRSYFSSLWWSIDTIISIAVPVLIGWLLVVGRLTAYRLLMLVSFFIFFQVGHVMKKIEVNRVNIRDIVLKKITRRWLRMRFIHIALGLLSGMNLFFPTLIVLKIIGNEKSLGIILSLCSLVTAIVIYQLGKFTKIRHRISIFYGGVGLTLFASLLLALFYSPFGVLMYLLIQAVAYLLIWTSIDPIAMDVTETESEGKEEYHYAYVFDRELFLNVGRVGTVGIFLFLGESISSSISLRLTLIFIAILLFLITYVFKSGIKQHVPVDILTSSETEKETDVI